MRRIIFLDIDGVLATGKVVRDGMWGLEEDKMRMLDDLVRELDCEIVISSSWRKDTIEATKEFMLQEGMLESLVSRISGVTIRAYHYLVKGAAISIPRGVEIKQWLDHNVHSGGNGLYVLGNNGTYVRRNIGIDYQYVILDDDSDMLLEQFGHFVRCDTSIGLTTDGIHRASQILK